MHSSQWFKSHNSSVPNGDVPSAAIGRSLTMRLDNIKRQYQRDLLPLTQQKEALVRELLELKEARDVFLEETAVLGARNEELAQLNAQYERKLELGHPVDRPTKNYVPPGRCVEGHVETCTVNPTASWRLITRGYDLRTRNVRLIDFRYGLSVIAPACKVCRLSVHEHSHTCIHSLTLAFYSLNQAIYSPCLVT